ncbi:mitogen-activated protein kinase kinase kinase 20-like [Typha angustifolia]|uniref:mitogen-activated protein kinase kinase kinase 20-like n=1 Tax=Typha angustifolia TaxID=59011 RepID=UPI003C2AD170
MDSTEWKIGAVLGRGTSATVRLAIYGGGKDDESIAAKLMAVKSAKSSYSSMLKRERQILEELDGCSQIVHCYGDDLSVNKYGKPVYSIFLEYAPSQSLSDCMKSSKSAFPESQVRRLTLSMLKGLVHIHSKGYVHCDIKPQNILLWSSVEVKIIDFGWARRSGKRSRGTSTIRGTPLYVAPEGPARNVYEKPADIWCLGCTVFEMLTGNPARWVPDNADMPTLLLQIGCGGLMRRIPETISKEGKDFLRMCLLREPERRWTAEMLLNHPFVSSGSAKHRSPPLSRSPCILPPGSC